MVHIHNLDVFSISQIDDKYDIYSPCNRAVEKFAPQCYYYHPEYVLERSNLTLEHNLTYAFAQCDNISPDKFAKYCYQGIGRLLQPIAYTNTEQAIAACYRGNQPTYREDCLIGTLKTILKQDAKTDVAFKFCSLSKPDFKAECYEIIGMWIKSFLYPNKNWKANARRHLILIMLSIDKCKSRD